MSKLTAPQKFVLSFAPFILTGPWYKYGGPQYGIQTVDQEPMRWELNPHWPATIRRLIKRGYLVRSGDVYYLTLAGRKA